MNGKLDDASSLYTQLRYLYVLLRLFPTYYSLLIFVLYTNRLPFDQNTVYGWVGEIIYSTYVSATYLFMSYVFIGFFATFSMHCRAYQQHFQSLIEKIDEYVQQHNNEESALQLFAAIRFRNLIKRYLI